MGDIFTVAYSSQLKTVYCGGQNTSLQVRILHATLASICYGLTSLCSGVTLKTKEMKAASKVILIIERIVSSTRRVPGNAAPLIKKRIAILIAEHPIKMAICLRSRKVTIFFTHTTAISIA